MPKARREPTRTVFDEKFRQAQQQRGTAEYLSTLLVNGLCPHSDKRKTADLPRKLGFFSGIDSTISTLETERICQACYNLAVPEGYNVWSTYYKEHQSERSKSESVRHIQRAINIPKSDDYYPLMYEAGTEHDPDTVPVNNILLPANAEAQMAWKLLVQLGNPFYVDQLHLTNPWNPDPQPSEGKSKEQARAEEDQRVARENLLAYEGAASGIIATGVGGAGKNSIVEQRILGKRGLEMPAKLPHSHSYNLPHETTENTGRFPQNTWVSGNQPDVRTSWPEGFTMPSEEVIDADELLTRGYVTGPTDNETHRRLYLEE